MSHVRYFDSMSNADDSVEAFAEKYAGIGVTLRYDSVYTDYDAPYTEFGGELRPNGDWGIIVLQYDDHRIVQGKSVRKDLGDSKRTIAGFWQLVVEVDDKSELNAIAEFNENANMMIDADPEMRCDGGTIEFHTGDEYSNGYQTITISDVSQLSDIVWFEQGNRRMSLQMDMLDDMLEREGYERVETDGGVPEIGATQMFTEDEEREMVYMSVFQRFGQCHVAAHFDCSQATVSRVINRYASHGGTELEESILEQFENGNNPNGLVTDGGCDLPPGEDDFRHGQPRPQPHYDDVGDYCYNERIYEAIKKATIEAAKEHPFDADRHNDASHRSVVKAVAEGKLFGQIHGQDIAGYGHSTLSAWLDNMVMVVTDPWEKTVDVDGHTRWRNTRGGGYRAVGLQRRVGGTWMAYLETSEATIERIGDEKYSMEFKASEFRAENR